MKNPGTDVSPALTSEQWRDLDYRPAARVIDLWAKEKPEHRDADDATQYVAKLGVTYDDCVLTMSRAHEFVSVPPPVRHVLAALALYRQRFGFEAGDVHTLESAATLLTGADASIDRQAATSVADALRHIAARIAALLPPADGEER